MFKNKLLLKYLLVIYLVISIPGTISALTITDNANVTITATVNSSNNSGGGGGGGGGSGSHGGHLIDYSFQTTVNFNGLAYPSAVVHVWKNAVPRITTIADKNGYFSVDLDEQYSNNAIYTLYTVDKSGHQSLLLNYPLAITNGYYTQVSGIRFAPTILTDKAEVRQNDSITVYGYALPNKNIQTFIDGPQSQTFNDVAFSDGTYKFTHKLDGFPKGEYNVRVNYDTDKRISKIIKFTISDLNVPSTQSVNNVPGDCNADQVINIIDFSVLAYWYGRPNPPACVDTNHDGIINLTDFSILAFYWTG